MRVLFVSDVYFPRVNGVSTSIRTFRTDLAQLGVETTLVAPAYPGAPEDGDPSIIRVPSGGVPMDPEDRSFKGGPLRAVLNRELAARVDLVHIHTPFIAHYAAARFARAHGLPLVATYHTFFEDYLHHYVPILPRAIGRFLARRFTRSQCRDVAELISPSAPMRDALQAYGVTTPIEVLPTGMSAESFIRGDGMRFRKQFELGAKRPLLLYVGRVAYEKNIDFLLRMFVKVRARRPEALFVIAGEGPARESLTRLARELGVAEAVRFIGYLDRRTDLPNCYAAGDAFVFASRTETQGLVLLAFVVPEQEETFAAAVVQALALPADAPQRVQLRTHAESWASQTMAKKLVMFYERVKAQHAVAAAGETAPA
jgi:1,2-diacylglycerol 3-alpha-glucosyltransferase